MMTHGELPGDLRNNFFLISAVNFSKKKGNINAKYIKLGARLVPERV